MTTELPCTDCHDTGITLQTERRCACQPLDYAMPERVALDHIENYIKECEDASKRGGPTIYPRPPSLDDLKALAGSAATASGLLDLVIRMHIEGAISEGQVAKASGLGRIEIRKLADDMRLSGAAGGREDAATDPDLGQIGPGHVCKHGIRWPHACEPCDDAAWAARERQASSP